MAARRYLLDVNVLIALFDDQHPHSRAAQSFMEKRPAVATCPLTENGVLRILNMPAYSRYAPVGFDAVCDKLRYIRTHADHTFWADDISLSDAQVLDWGRVSGHHQITDAYLLALAVKNGGTLASFDQRIALSAVRGATPEHFVLL